MIKHFQLLGSHLVPTRFSTNVNQYCVRWLTGKVGWFDENKQNYHCLHCSIPVVIFWQWFHSLNSFRSNLLTAFKAMILISIYFIYFFLSFNWKTFGYRWWKHGNYRAANVILQQKQCTFSHTQPSASLNWTSIPKLNSRSAIIVILSFSNSSTAGFFLCIFFYRIRIINEICKKHSFFFKIENEPNGTIWSRKNSNEQYHQ